MTPNPTSTMTRPVSQPRRRAGQGDDPTTSLIDDIRVWQAEQRRLQAALHRVSLVLAQHDAELAEHELRLRRQAQGPTQGSDASEMEEQARAVHAQVAQHHSEALRECEALLSMVQARES